MATYLKRTSKLYDLTMTHAASADNNINFSDLMCPVCRGILIEPVTLPCDHNLCLRCLKGALKHNSLSCPMCRVRVGSWLRTATKSETLVNNNLWEFIRSNYPKEIQDKTNVIINDVPHINNQPDYTQNILSSGGGIHCGYELQLKLAEQEMLRQRESERLVNEQYLRKLHEPEQDDKQKLTQYAQDRLLARTLTKTQLLDKEKTIKYYNECLKNTTHQPNKYLVPQSGDCLQNELLQFNNNNNNNNNKQLLLPASDPLQLNSHLFNLNSINIKTGPANLLSRNIDNDIRMSSNINLMATKLQPIDTRQSFSSCPSKPSSIVRTKDCCQLVPSSSLSSTLLIPNILTLKQQTMPKMNAYITTEPGCSNSTLNLNLNSNSKIYGDQNEEELRVPADLLSNNKKNLAMEICVMTTGIVDDKQQRVSAQSAGSHDSINPEIHHFKPIKILPRTPLKLMPDGRQIDPKIVRVVPVLKRIGNPVFRAPSVGHFRRIGCTWSAFKGRIRQEARIINTSPTWKSPQNSTELNQNQSKTQSLSQVSTESNSPKQNLSTETTEVNKNNHLINGTAAAITSPPTLTLTSTKSAKAKSKSSKNGALKRNKNKADLLPDDKPASLEDSQQKANEVPIIDDNESQAMENIAERIKRRKVNQEPKTTYKIEDDDGEDCNGGKIKSRTRKSSRKVVSGKAETEDTDKKIKTPKKVTRKRGERLKVLKFEDSVDLEDKSSDSEKLTRKRTTRSSARNCKNKLLSYIGDDIDNDNDNDNNNKINGVHGSNNDDDDNNDERVIVEEENIERLSQQEKQDYELARRLQAEFNEMELGISRRTRGSKRTPKSSDDSIPLNARALEIRKKKRGNININGKLIANATNAKPITPAIKSRRKRD
ncbi:uncharacterized protein LOC141534145 isoform X1 [Cotesia typhae]|uniref:uncharacterized protein LOC141534145 isoform X1 n=2 Tax=Cotesia typhae TaxID=2053667 RepID=UPI003D687D7C